MSKISLRKYLQAKGKICHQFRHCDDCPLKGNCSFDAIANMDDEQYSEWEHGLKTWLKENTEDDDIHYEPAEFTEVYTITITVHRPDMQELSLDERKEHGKFWTEAIKQAFNEFLDKKNRPDNVSLACSQEFISTWRRIEE